MYFYPTASSNLCIGEHSFIAAVELACTDHSVLSLFGVPLDQCHPLLDDSLRSSISLSNTFDEDRFLMASEPMSPPLGAAQVEKSVKLDDEWELVHESAASVPAVSESIIAAEPAQPAHAQPHEEAAAPHSAIAASAILVEAPVVEDPHAACHARYDEVLSREAAGVERLTEVNTELNAVRAEIAATKQELNQSQQDAEQQLLTAQHSMQDKINAVTQEKVEAQLRSVQLQNELQHLTSQTSTWKLAVSTLQAKSTDLETQLAAARQDIVRSSSESAVVKQELASMQEMRDQLSEEKRQKEAIQARLAQVESELEQNNLQHQSMQSIVATVQSQISEVRAQSASAQLEYQAQIDRMKSNSHQELTSLRAKLDSSKLENVQLQSRVAQLEQELRLSNAQVVARQSTATALQAQVSELRALLTLARQEIQTLIDNGKHVSESDVPRVPVAEIAPSDVASIAASIVLHSPATDSRGPADPDQADLEAIRLAMTQSFCGGVAPDELLTQQLIQQQQQQQEDDEFDAGTQSAELVSQVGVPFAGAANANESLIALVCVRNSGADAWIANTVDLVHVAGESFGVKPSVGLTCSQSVPRGGRHLFDINMKVPSAPGHHLVRNRLLILNSTQHFF
jgi:predicted  nucleic acid-binding Zn-ribbon protein